MTKFILLTFVFLLGPSLVLAYGYDEDGYYGGYQNYPTQNYPMQTNRNFSYYGCYPYCGNLDQGGDYFYGMTPDSSWLQRPYFEPRYYDNYYGGGGHKKHRGDHHHSHHRKHKK